MDHGEDMTGGSEVVTLHRAPGEGPVEEESGQQSGHMASGVVAEKEEVVS